MTRKGLRYLDNLYVRAAAVASSASLAVPGKHVFPWKVAIGPYLFSVVWADEKTMTSRRRLAEECSNQQIIRLSKKLSGVKLARYFLRSVLFLTLYAAGVNDRKVDEEQAAHLLATGFVELIVRNPEVCAWLTELLTLRPRVARPVIGAPASLPRAVCLGQSEYAIKAMSPAFAARAGQWGDIDLRSRIVRLNEELQGTHMGVIFWHEVLHGIHKEHGLRSTRNPDTAYLRVHTEGIIGFIRENPLVWRWFVGAMHRAALAHSPAPKAKKRTATWRPAPRTLRLRIAA